MVINEPLTTKGNGNLEEVGGSSVALAHSLDAPRTVLEKEDFEVRGCVISGVSRSPWALGESLCDAERAAFIMARCS
jgi:hypothetical protein